MYKVRQILIVAWANFRRWRRSPQIWLAFALGFVASFLLSDKVMVFAKTHETILQLFEPFIWTFGDANSILLISLCLLLLFADMPNLGNEVPLFLVRTSRGCFLAGQILYLMLATIIYVAFILLSTCVLSGKSAYIANLWSETAAILGYSAIGEQIAIPAFVKVLEFSFPYRCTLHIFGLMLGYSLMLSSLIFCFNLWRDKFGMIAGIIFSGFGFVLNPEMIAKWMGIIPQRMAEANIIFGWISPLNHATYYMHNFGYDSLPRLWMSYVIFGIGSVVFYLLAYIRIRKYPFNFNGTEK